LVTERFLVMAMLVQLSSALYALRPHPVARCAGQDLATTTSVIHAPLFRFTETGAGDDVEKFERIDDVIMGGVSKSSLTLGAGSAVWRGLVRTDGGGFCGQRTRPFERPLNLSGADGVYMDCALMSDEDVSRRAWKMTMRTDEGRGEVVYQAAFQPGVGSVRRVEVPFSDFRLVRGPVAIPGAPKVSNVSAVYQIGFTVSKFVISEQMQMMEDFRNGTFQLDIKEIGAFSRQGVAAPEVPETLADGKVKRSIVQKMLFPLLALFFGEATRRRKRASTLLRQRGLGAWKQFRFAWLMQRRQQKRSPPAAAAVLGARLAKAAATFVLGLPLRLILFPIFRLQARKERQRLRAKLEAEEKKDLETPGTAGR